MISRNLKLSGLLTEIRKNFFLKLPPEIELIHNAFKKNGRKIYVVGGAVRDALLNKMPKDFDLTTDVKPEEVVKILNKFNIKNFPKGEAFGVVSAIINEKEFEIATMREEKYEDGGGRRPTSVSFSNLESDVLRRDLSFNALYYDIDKKQIIDLVGGIDDLKNKKIKSVGSPMERFEEDKLRVLRFIRFAHRFGSKIDDKAKKAILFYKDLSGVSNERIRDEFLRGLSSSINPEKYLKDYQDLQLFPRVFQRVNINKNFITGLKDPILVISYLLLPNDIDDVLKSLENFKATNTEKENVKFLLMFKNKFQNFNKSDFYPDIDGKWFLGLHNSFTKKNKNLTEEQLLEWGRINKIDLNLIKKFVEFNPDVMAKEFPNIKGAELGNAITNANAEKFKKSL